MWYGNLRHLLNFIQYWYSQSSSTNWSPWGHYNWYATSSRISAQINIATFAFGVQYHTTYNEHLPTNAGFFTSNSVCIPSRITEPRLHWGINIQPKSHYCTLNCYCSSVYNTVCKHQDPWRNFSKYRYIWIDLMKTISVYSLNKWLPTVALSMF